MNRICVPAPETGALTEHERFMWVVDRFVMSVTEALCRLEREQAEPGQPAFHRRKAVILDGLGQLDRLMISYRATDPLRLLAAMPTVAEPASAGTERVGSR